MGSRWMNAGVLILSLQYTGRVQHAPSSLFLKATYTCNTPWLYLVPSIPGLQSLPVAPAQGVMTAAAWGVQ